MTLITEINFDGLVNQLNNETSHCQTFGCDQSTKSRLKNAQKIVKEANRKIIEDERNKSKKLQRILQDHEDIIDVIRTEMARVGFDSEQQDFYACACDIKFDVLEHGGF